MNEPFISINRQMFDGLVNEFQGRQRCAIRTLWFYLLYHANWADNGGLKRGQIFVGRRSLAIETGLTERVVRTLLNALKSVPPSAQQVSHQVTTTEVIENNKTNKKTLFVG